MSYELFSDGTVLIDIQLEPLGLVLSSGGNKLVEWTWRQRGNHLDNILLGTCQCQDLFTIGMTKFAKCSGGDVQRHGCLSAQQTSRHIHFLNIHHHARLEPKSVESIVVLSHSDLIISSRWIISPSFGFQNALCDTYWHTHLALSQKRFYKKKTRRYTDLRNQTS